MNNLSAYLSYIMWQLVILYNYIIRSLIILTASLKDTYFIILYYYFPPDDIIFIENFTIKFGCRFENFFKLTLRSFDYFVFNHTVDNKTLKKISSSIKELPIYIDTESNLPLLPKPCYFQFIMVLFKTGDKSFDITNILNDKDNFYYVQNAIIFDNNFIDWICLKHLKIKLTDVIVAILDNNAEEINITQEQCIHLGTNGYSIELINESKDLV
jgi:hypothetical protein